MVASMQRSTLGQLARGFSLAVAVAVVPLGCYGGSNDDSDSTGNTTTSGTEACQSWQRAICDWVARCGGDATECRDQAPAVTCLSDAEAQRCAAGFDSASCSAPPSACDLGDIADPQPAIDGCNAFISALCDRSEECEAGSHDTCVSTNSSSLDCSTAVGLKPSYDQCMSEISTLACDATMLPDPCRAVVLLLQ